MKASAKTHARREASEVAGPIELLHERELHQIIETVLRLAKKIGVEETEVHVDEAADALTRFANNAIHQNVAEHGLTVSIRTVLEGRTARATTNRIDEDSLRNAIRIAFAGSQPTKKSALASDAGSAEIFAGESLCKTNGRGHSRRPCAGSASRV